MDINTPLLSTFYPWPSNHRDLSRYLAWGLACLCDGLGLFYLLGSRARGIVRALAATAAFVLMLIFIHDALFLMALLWRQDGPSYERISGVRSGPAPTVDGAEARVQPPPRRAQSPLPAESPQAGTEAEGQAAFRNGPRRGIRRRLVSVWGVPESDQILVHQATADGAITVEA